MSDSLLSFSSLAAEESVYCHIYYGSYYVGRIIGSNGPCTVWLHEVGLGDFESIDEAKRAVREWYYGPE